MLIFQVQLITLLLFIGDQRSLASPVTTAGSSLNSVVVFEEEEEKEEQRKHVTPQTVDGKENRGLEHQWDCEAESDYIQEQIALTSKMLSDGERISQKQKDQSADETVLVLGKAGSGKTSLVQFLTHNPKLQSKKVRSDTGEYIIDDGEKIGTSATESFTLYPELVEYNSTITFCDSPGFHDSRSSAHEIVSMDVMKSTTKRFKKAKIVLIEKHGSLQYGMSKDNFINTLRHLNDFLVDIEKYKNSIVLIASKIPLTYKITDDESAIPELVTEDMHIESIIDYLNRTEISIAEKLTQKISNKEKKFYGKVVGLLKSLQTRDENGKASRINVFRRPYKSGPLKNMSLLEKNRESLYKTIMNMDFVNVEENDFDYTLSDKGKLYLECLLKLTSDNYKNKINELSFKLNEFVTHKTQNYTSFYQVMADLVALHDSLKQLSGNLDETKNYNEFFEKINGFISEQNITLQINYNERIHILEKYEEILLKFVDTSMVFTPSSWTLPIRQVMKSAEDELEWYKTINKFIAGMSSYETQKNKSEIYSTLFHEDSTSTNNLITFFMSVTGSKNVKQFIDAQTDTRKRSEVETITKALLQQSNITCDDNGRLIVKGFQIRIAEINSESLVLSYCNITTVKEVVLQAVDTVFLDEDTADIFKGVNLFVAAPKWKVIGERRVVLSGQPGSHISDNPYVDNGKDGKPGKPGGNGGSFFGLGLQFLNGDNLRIESNGGRGGAGVDGMKGDRGEDGRNGSKNLKLGVYSQKYEFTRGISSDSLANSISSNRYDDYFTLKNLNIKRYYDYYYGGEKEIKCDAVTAGIQLFNGEGDCGENGGPGGMGGEAGRGGLSGEQQLIELGDSSQIKLESQNGSIGTRGSMGQPGDRGEDGIGMICVNVYDSTKTQSYWSCLPTNTTSPACNTCQKFDQNVEHQFTTSGMQQPAPKTSPDFSHYLLDYTGLLEAHTDNTLFNKIITDFRTAIHKKFLYNLNDMGLLFFKGIVQKKSE